MRTVLFIYIFGWHTCSHHANLKSFFKQEASSNRLKNCIIAIQPIYCFLSFTFRKEISPFITCPYSRSSLVAQLVKNLPAIWETWVWYLGWEEPLENGTAYPLQCSGLENSMDCTVHGVTKSQTGLGYCHFHLAYTLQLDIQTNRRKGAMNFLTQCGLRAKA